LQVHRQSIVLITPALSDANNGNWQTARRWARMLSPHYRVTVARDWTSGHQHLMIALHARRSAASILAWKSANPDRPLILVLTGTDLYRDIDSDADAQAALERADALVVLNELGPRRLPPHLRARCRIILQSCTQRRALAKPASRLRALMVGHLREEKDPRTFFRAVQLLSGRTDILFDHIGAALDPGLGREARELMSRQPDYRWLGALPHAQVRRRIQSAHLLVHPSKMEGGAHVVIEALRSGTAVLASRIDGNLGVLGEDYPGIFEPGDAAGLASMIAGLRGNPADLRALEAQCGRRAGLFTPEAESSALNQLVSELLNRPGDPG
jgi:putative glycosyltransferase (TIGR04348 family)